LPCATKLDHAPCHRAISPLQPAWVSCPAGRARRDFTERHARPTPRPIARSAGVHGPSPPWRRRRPLGCRGAQDRSGGATRTVWTRLGATRRSSLPAGAPPEGSRLGRVAVDTTEERHVRTRHTEDGGPWDP
jgi:hypothetical protein